MTTCTAGSTTVSGGNSCTAGANAPNSEWAEASGEVSFTATSGNIIQSTVVQEEGLTSWNISASVSESDTIAGTGSLQDGTITISLEEPVEVVGSTDTLSISDGTHNYSFSCAHDQSPLGCVDVTLVDGHSILSPITVTEPFLIGAPITITATLQESMSLTAGTPPPPNSGILTGVTNFDASYTLSPDVTDTPEPSALMIPGGLMVAASTWLRKRRRNFPPLL